jgi:hypothetical protein
MRFDTAAADLESFFDEDLSPLTPSLDPATLTLRSLVDSITKESASLDLWNTIRLHVDTDRDEHRALRREAATKLRSFGIVLPTTLPPADAAE